MEIFAWMPATLQVPSFGPCLLSSPRLAILGAQLSAEALTLPWPPLAMSGLFPRRICLRSHLFEVGGAVVLVVGATPW